MMKDEIKKMIDKKTARLAELKKRAKETENIAELRALNEDVDDIIDELNELKALYGDADRPRDDDRRPRGNDDGNDNGNVNVKIDEGRSMNVLASQTAATHKNEKRAADPYGTVEYREAFRQFVLRGTPIPAEFRGDAITTTTDASAVIPTTILHEIISQKKVYGNLFDEVRKLNIKGGVTVPILSLKPSATWISANTGTSESDKQKLQANTSVTFNYYGLECKVAQTLLVETVALPIFEEQFARLATEAMIKALDIAIMNGTGVGEPLGITADTRVPAGNKITLLSTEIGNWDDWKKKVFGKMAKAYRDGKFYMAQSTFDGYIDGMVDSNGQPIGRVNYGIDGDERYRFGGKIVDTVENDVIKDYDTASVGDVIAVFVKPTDYAFNSNLTMQAVKWTDHDKNEVVNKLILIGDGKLLDPNGVLIIKKGA